ncbi:MAG: hypothetical protein JWQ14_2614 [Adhaeribacter sp.]|nr:hypothetical protein [Adhaeribacter sp.]
MAPTEGRLDVPQKKLKDLSLMGKLNDKAMYKHAVCAVCRTPDKKS